VIAIPDSAVAALRAPRPYRFVARARSRWASLIDRLEEGDHVRGGVGRTLESLSPPLTKAEQNALRWAAGWRGRGVRIRNTPAATTVWLGGEIKGYRNRKRPSKR